MSLPPSPPPSVWIAGNWKMNGRIESAGLLARKIREGLAATQVNVACFPPFVHLAAVAEALRGSPVRLGAQACAETDDGAHTGEVSAAQLADAGCTMVLVGHSERRREAGETGARAGRKLSRALAAGLTPIYCVGETSAERKAGATLRVVAAQLEEGLAPSLERARDCLVAYEPVWAIGTGVVATPETAGEVHAAIRRWLVERLGETGSAVPILYGGSVTSDNATGLLARSEIDGALVGGASLSAEAFVGIVRTAEQKTKGKQ